MNRIAIVTESPDQLMELFSELGTRGWSCVVIDPRTGTVEADDGFAVVVTILLPKLHAPAGSHTLLVSAQQGQGLLLHEPLGTMISVVQLANRIEQLARPAKHQDPYDALSHMADWDAAI
jgi:hypothetical protein